MNALNLNELILLSVQEACDAVLRSGGWRSYEGVKSKELNDILSERVAQPYCQLTASGTAALEILLRAAEIGASDEVMLSSYDYPGNFWAIERVGARPVLLDTESTSWRISRSSLDEMYTPTCKALIASHLHGQIQQVAELREWCEQRNVMLIEDACQALGAQCSGGPVGSFGHAAVFSFGGGKLLSCGRGGAWGTADEALAVKARVASGAGSGPYAMSELQAAIVCAQWPFLEQINNTSRDFFRLLTQELHTNCPSWQFIPKDSLPQSAFYQCGWMLEESLAEHRDELVSRLRSPESESTATANFASTNSMLAFGKGFVGFHRRTTRRCRKPNSLENAISASDRTVVLHHSAALEQKLTATDLACWVKLQTKSVQQT